MIYQEIRLKQLAAQEPVVEISPPDKLTLLRRLYKNQPTIAEQVLLRWGAADLHSYTDALIEYMRASTSLLLRGSISTLRELQRIHATEFPQHAIHEDAARASSGAALLIQNPDFAIVQERLPHLAERLARHWGMEAFHHTIDDLFKDNRRRVAASFPLDVYTAIGRLSDEHDVQHPHAAKQQNPHWSHNKPR
jgi:hypothetical protein